MVGVVGDDVTELTEGDSCVNHAYTNKFLHGIPDKCDHEPIMWPDGDGPMYFE